MEINKLMRWLSWLDSVQLRWSANDDTTVMNNQPGLLAQVRNKWRRQIN